MGKKNGQLMFVYIYSKNLANCVNTCDFLSLHFHFWKPFTESSPLVVWWKLWGNCNTLPSRTGCTSGLSDSKHVVSPCMSTLPNPEFCPPATLYWMCVRFSLLPQMYWNKIYLSQPGKFGNVRNNRISNCVTVKNKNTAWESPVSKL